ncbi:MAG: hypothetical protein DELT_02435 [Desulfovibrio sp.]
MDNQTNGRSPEFQQFLQQVEIALIKSSAEARRIAEQTGTKLIVRENFEQEAPTKCPRRKGHYPSES